MGMLCSADLLVSSDRSSASVFSLDGECLLEKLEETIQGIFVAFSLLTNSFHAERSIETLLYVLLLSRYIDPNSGSRLNEISPGPTELLWYRPQPSCLTAIYACFSANSPIIR